MTPLLERIQRFLEAFPDAEYIPVHPSDAVISTYKNLPVLILGEIHRSKS
ncbi:hypothetical protein [Allohahella sp. A8]